jgi:hypothetical protein
MKVRKNKKATNTETALKRILTQISKANISPKQAIELCVEKSWSGFESDWYQNLKQQTTNKPKEYDPNAHTLKIIDRLAKDGGISPKQAEIARLTIINSPTRINVQQLIDGIEKLKTIGDDFDIVSFRNSLRIE